jgi:S1-C subfamily serine protease
MLIMIITDNSFALERIPVSAPISSDFAGEGSIVAINSVVRVMCLNTKLSGTGFLHKSGKIITAQHVVENCVNAVIINSKGELRHVTSTVSDNVIDLSLLTIDKELNNKAFNISLNDNVNIGLQVSTWGYPAGYGGYAPLLSVGYLSGIEHFRTSTGKVFRQLVVNAAFNSGNSGGPLLDIEKGEVIGVVSSKLAPIPDNIKNNLNILAKDKKQGIFTYSRTLSDGRKVPITEGQVVAEVLDYLRGQVQLVIGYAVSTKDIREFLRANNVDP